MPAARGRAPHAPPGAGRDKPGLWAHLISKERTLGYIATAQATASGHIYAISRVISTLRLWPHTPIRARAYDTLGEGATP